LPKTFFTSDFHCVEGWSMLNFRWEGVRFKEIEKLVKPLETAPSQTFECIDYYTTSFFREELAGDDVLLAYRLNGQELGEGHGFSLRLVAKKIRLGKCITIVHLRFSRAKGLGF
jgi:DMSO/TMAO reductase YedYZ molybdopterin-dependent catalytic subunit